MPNRASRRNATLSAPLRAPPALRSNPATNLPGATWTRDQVGLYPGEAQVLDLDGGQHIEASITKDAAEELGLAVGTRVTAVVKATEVMIGVD
jgi:molybdopterin-binding protein